MSAKAAGPPPPLDGSVERKEEEKPEVKSEPLPSGKEAAVSPKAHPKGGKKPKDKPKGKTKPELKPNTRATSPFTKRKRGHSDKTSWHGREPKKVKRAGKKVREKEEYWEEE